MRQFFERYGFWGIIVLFCNLVKTKLVFRNARLIRFPIDIRGSRFIQVSEGFTTGRYCRFEAYPKEKDEAVLCFGRNVQINDFVHITAMEKVSIGNNVLMASKIYISDCSHGFYDGEKSDSSPCSLPINRAYKTSPVTICDNVWIGESVSILPGVTIGKGSIIGANSVVTKNVSEYSIAVGNPAKVVKKYNFEREIWERV